MWPFFDELPSYPLVRFAGDSEAEVRRLASDVFRLKDFTVTSGHDGDVFIATERDSQRVVEWHPNAGVIWFADWARLWNPDERPTLPPADKARADGEQFLRDHGLLPTSSPGFCVTICPPHSSGTLRTKPGEGTPSLPLDVHVALPVTVKDAKGKDVPLAGRGTKWSVTYGHEGRLINCLAGRLRLAGNPTFSRVVSLKDIFELLLRVLLKHKKFEVSVVYERLQDAENVDWLMPMYLVHIETESLSRLVRFPASEHSQRLLTGLQTKFARVDTLRLNAEQTVRMVREQGLGRSLGLGAAWSREDKDPYGLKSEETRAFIEEMQQQHWRMCEFDDAAALERHWNAQRDDFVEQADFAHYTGHAGQNGWDLQSPADTTLDPSDVDDRPYGREFVNWIMISACGPLQDPAILPSTDGTAASRWFDAFGGLLGLCGFASQSLGRTDMGTVLARALQDYSVPRAWFRACRECQPLVVDEDLTDGFGIWAATFTADEANEKGVRVFDMRLTDGLGSGRRRERPAHVLGMWTPV